MKSRRQRESSFSFGSFQRKGLERTGNVPPQRRYRLDELVHGDGEAWRVALEGMSCGERVGQTVDFSFVLHEFEWVWKGRRNLSQIK